MLDADGFKLRAGLLEIMAGVAVSRVEGAWGMGVRPDHAEDLRKRKNLAKGIKAEVNESRVTVELDLVIDYGKDFQQVSRRVQSEVKETIEGMTGWTVEAVDVHVAGVNAP